jgi:hypothetical protein
MAEQTTDLTLNRELDRYEEQLGINTGKEEIGPKLVKWDGDRYVPPQQYSSSFSGVNEFWRSFSSDFVNSLKTQLGKHVADIFPTILQTPDEVTFLFGDNLKLGDPEQQIGADKLFLALFENLASGELKKRVINGIIEESKFPGLEEMKPEEAERLWLSYLSGMVKGIKQWVKLVDNNVENKYNKRLEELRNRNIPEAEKERLSQREQRVREESLERISAFLNGLSNTLGQALSESGLISENG